MKAESSVTDHEMFIRAAQGVESAEREVLHRLESKYRKQKTGMYPFCKEDDRFYITDYVVEGELDAVRRGLEKYDLKTVQEYNGLMVEIGRIRVGDKALPVVLSVFWLIVSNEENSTPQRVLAYQVCSMVAHHGWAKEWLKATTGCQLFACIYNAGMKISRDLAEGSHES